MQNRYDTPLKFEQQVERLDQHKIKFSNKEKVKKHLSNTSYYRIKGYWFQFKKQNSEEVIDDITFNKILKIIEFDTKFKSEIYQLIGLAEVKLRTLIAYYLSTNHGAYSFTDSKYFTDASKHSDIILSFKKEKRRNKNLPFVYHYDHVHKGLYPIWVAIELFSLSNTISLFEIMLDDDKKCVEDELGIDSSKIISWFRSIAKVRNICAHHGRIYNLSFGNLPALFKEFKQYSNDKIFHIILLLKRLCIDFPKDWKSFVGNIQKLIRQYQKYIDLDCIGFKENWTDILNQNIDLKENDD